MKEEKKSYLVTGKQEALEKILEETEITITHQFKYIPVTAIETTLEYEVLEKLLPDYHIQEEKTMEAYDD